MESERVTPRTKREAAHAGPRRVGGGWLALPLYLRICLGLVLGVVAGVALGGAAQPLDVPARLVLRVLGALAPVLILVAILHAVMTAEIGGRTAVRLVSLLLLNTLTAIVVGIAVANVVAPGAGVNLSKPAAPPSVERDVWKQLIDNVPESLLGPFVDNRVIGVVLIALAFGLASRRLSPAQRRSAEELTSLSFSLLLIVLSWTIELVPFAVFGKVASIVGVHGFGPFLALGRFVLAVLSALALQSAYYLVRVRLGSWVRPSRLIAGARDALVMAFSTASSTVTMPLTYERLRQLGLRERSASLGALVGSNFNNDGTALYEAMAALFVAQMVGVKLGLLEQIMIVLTSVVASVGAAGIPEAGLVTMTLVFTAVKLPTEYIALLLTVDWFLDRCRTMINVLGDMNVACLLDGKTPDGPTAAGPS